MFTFHPFIQSAQIFPQSANFPPTFAQSAHYYHSHSKRHKIRSLLVERQKCQKWRSSELISSINAIRDKCLLRMIPTWVHIKTKARLSFCKSKCSKYCLDFKFQVSVIICPRCEICPIPHSPRISTLSIFLKCSVDFDNKMFRKGVRPAVQYSNILELELASKMSLKIANSPLNLYFSLSAYFFRWSVSEKKMLVKNSNRPIQKKEMYKTLGTKWRSLNSEEKR